MRSSLHAWTAPCKRDGFPPHVLSTRWQRALRHQFKLGCGNVGGANFSHKFCGGVSKITSPFAGNTIQAPCCISDSSCCGPHPEYPVNTRKRLSSLSSVLVAFSNCPLVPRNTPGQTSILLSSSASSNSAQ